jgi:single-stranded-DNA-specific exonuclease
MYAAGLTMKRENVEIFKRKFEEVVAKTITDEQLLPHIMIDTEIEFTDITPKFVRILKQFQPFGPKNMSPVFLTRSVLDAGNAKTVGKFGEHLKLDLRQTDNPELIFPAIGFQLGECYSIVRTGIPFDVCYTVEENTFRGETKIQLQVKGIRIN